MTNRPSAAVHRLARRIGTGAILFTVLTSCAAGNGIPGEEVRPLAGEFHDIVADGAFRLIVVADAPFLRLAGDKNLLSHITTDVADDHLQVKIDPSLSFQKTPEIEVHVPSLKKIVERGTVVATAQGLAGHALAIVVHGNSVFSSGLGTFDEITIDADGATRVVAIDLSAQQVSVTASGTANISVNAQRALTAQLEGASNLLVQGRPSRVEKTIAGAATITLAP